MIVKAKKVTEKEASYIFVYVLLFQEWQISVHRDFFAVPQDAP